MTRLLRPFQQRPLDRPYSKRKRRSEISLHALEKEKRRLRDQKLKEQKQNSKRQKKTKEVEVAEEEEEKQAADEETVAEQEEEADESSSSNNDNNTNTTASDTRLLPAELLAQAAADEKSIGKRSHLTAADFERMEKEEQEKAAERMNKKRKRDEHRVGEYTVKVINNRPRPAPTDAKILNFKKRSLQRKAIPRKDALLQKSQHKKNIGKAALQFHRR
ncbi:hypothetical protein BX666DRAFT_708197 [Dichotomocladium elegans]|nr:hypothetical protein BX666DRAFT_708197 [Dichotomocladium elegans]